jgi:hypothetical protein
LKQGIFDRLDFHVEKSPVGLRLVLRSRRERYGCDLVRSSELLREFENSFVDKDGDGVVVEGVGFAAQAQRFEGNGPATGEAIEHPRSTSAKGFAEKLAGFLKGLAPRSFTGNGFPGSKLLDEPEQFVAAVGVIGQKCRQGHRTGSGQWFAGPPDVQRGYVPVANVLFPHRFFGNLAQRKIHFDQPRLVHNRPRCFRYCSVHDTNCSAWGCRTTMSCSSSLLGVS